MARPVSSACDIRRSTCYVLPFPHSLTIEHLFCIIEPRFQSVIYASRYVNASAGA